MSARTSSLLFTTAVSLMSCLWIWDHMRLRDELQSLRTEISAIAPLKFQGRPFGPADIKAGAHLLPETSPAAQLRQHMPAGDSRLLRAVAESLATKSDVFLVERRDGIVSAVVNPVVAELYGLTLEEQQSCAQALSAAMTEASALNREVPEKWLQTEERPERQVFRRVRKAATREGMKALKARVLQEWNAALRPDQSSAFERAIDQLPAGSDEELEEVEFDVSPDGNVQEKTKVWSGEVVFVRTSTGHGAIVPPRLTELRNAAR